MPTNSDIQFRLQRWPLFAGLLLFLSIAGCTGKAHSTAEPAIASPAAATPRDPNNAKTKPDAATRNVELIIDFGEGVQKRFTDIEWHESMTVLDVLNVAKEHSHGISFSTRGSGETLLVTKLDDLANQGAASGDKNWIFRVNGRLGDESCAIVKVQPGDSVLWKFGAYE